MWHRFFRGVPHVSAQKEIVIEKYNLEWPLVFQGLKQKIWPNISDIANAVEHIGSTAVPGLAAKPVIDIVIVIDSTEALPDIISRLEKMGYSHEGIKGIEGREAFKSPEDTPAHHLYVCQKSATSFKNHILLRDYLRKNPEAAREYGALKTRLAEKFKDDREGYTEAKTPFITNILAEAGIQKSDLESIRHQNVSPRSPKT